MFFGFLLFIHTSFQTEEGEGIKLIQRTVEEKSTLDEKVITEKKEKKAGDKLGCFFINIISSVYHTLEDKIKAIKSGESLSYSYLFGYTLLFIAIVYILAKIPSILFGAFLGFFCLGWMSKKKYDLKIERN